MIDCVPLFVVNKLICTYCSTRGCSFKAKEKTTSLLHTQLARPLTDTRPHCNHAPRLGTFTHDRRFYIDCENGPLFGCFFVFFLAVRY